MTMDAETSSQSTAQLNTTQARVVACLVEKSITTPAYYPMTVNAIMNAANQKSSRNPVMSLTEGQVGAALNQLADAGWVERDDSSARSVKWRQRFMHHLLLKPELQAVLVTLILRGPQTRSELRSHSSSLRGPDDLDGIDTALERLSDRAVPLVVQLPRGAGQKETRWAHLLSGEPEIPDAPVSVSTGRDAGLAGRVDALEAQVEQPKSRLDALESGGH